MIVYPIVWYGTRKLDSVPPHFVKSSTPLTNEAFIWVKARLVGRYAVHTSPQINELVFDLKPYIYFEDPKEVSLYELRWSGSK
jgi:hypothetical protein